MLMKFLRRVLLRVMKLMSFSAPSSTEWQHRLAIRGRATLSNADFAADDRLHRGFCLADLDDAGDIYLASFESRDLSCNWSRFASAGDIRHRERGRDSDGCYSITVRIARHQNLATPCHDPIRNVQHENYAHVEIRWLLPGESVLDAPPHRRKNR